MEIIDQNPYRIVGILSNASERDKQKQKTKMQAYLKVGKEVKTEYDFGYLSKLHRTEEQVSKALSSIEQNPHKVHYSLFWFINASPFDNTALDYLKNGDEEKAVEIWEKVTNDKEVSLKNYSAFNNLGTYKLISLSNLGIQEGIEAKIKLIESKHFVNFVHSVADETFTIDNQKQVELLIDELLIQFKGQYSSSETFQLFRNCNENVQQYLLRKFTEDPLHKIESQIENCKKKRKANKGKAYEFGLSLFTNTKEDLSTVKTLLGNNDLKYQAIADKLANEIMQCGIDYFNQNQENQSTDNYLESAQKLTKLADSIAVGRLTKDRAKDSLTTLEDLEDRELNHAIALLESIKMAFEKAISEIDAQVVAIRMTMSYDQTINYSKVDRMKANCLDWSKVTEVVSNGITSNDVEVIKRSSNHSKISEYKRLVDFLFSKLGPIQINKVKHLCYWRDVRADQVKTAAKKIGRTATNTVKSVDNASGGCLSQLFNYVMGYVIIFLIIGGLIGIGSLFGC